MAQLVVDGKMLKEKQLEQALGVLQRCRSYLAWAALRDEALGAPSKEERRLLADIDAVVGNLNV